MLRWIVIEHVKYIQLSSLTFLITCSNTFRLCFLKETVLSHFQSLFQRYLLFCLFVYVEKSLDKKTKVNSKFMTSHTAQQKFQFTYCPISHIVKAIRQWNMASSQNKTWETFTSQIMKKTRQGDYFQTSSCFFKLTLRKVKASCQHLNFIIF